MNRRTFFSASAAAALARPAAAARKGVFELRYFRLRNTRANQVKRTSDFLANAVLPAAGRAGIGPLGFFSGAIAVDSPFILMLAGFPSLAGMEQAREKLAADKDYQIARDQFNSSDFNYMRMESSLLVGFESMPAIEVPPGGADRPPRVFELRVYESTNTSTLARKIKMFDEGEIALFRKCGILPVFFGETIAGQNMPNLTYMVAFDDMAARDKAWQTFVNHPEWKQMSARPEYADADIVSNISNSVLRPLSFSPIR